MQTEPRAVEVSAVDTVGLLWSALLVLAAVAFTFFIAPPFERMLSDFSSHPPFLTTLVLRRWPVLAAALVPAALTGAGWLSGASPSTRLRIVVASVAWGVALVAFALLAIYLPIFATADALR